MIGRAKRKLPPLHVFGRLENQVESLQQKLFLLSNISGLFQMGDPGDNLIISQSMGRELEFVPGFRSFVRVPQCGDWEILPDVMQHQWVRRGNGGCTDESINVAQAGAK
jgi:hypothetical protein